MASKRNNKFKKTNISRKKNGGKTIDSGGFGCIFKPALKCNFSNKNDGKISKLLEKKNAETEYNKIQKVKNLVKNINNYNDYFFVDNITLCKPKYLTENDLENIEICKNLFNNVGISLNEINNNLHKFLIINMPYGGENLLEIISKNKKEFASINKILLKLLVYAILPINKLGFFHCDIKAQNILYLNEKARLIDWGISVFVKDLNLKKIPKLFKDNKLHYNSPFTSIIFNNLFDKYYDNHIKNNKNINQDNNNLSNIFQVIMYNYYIYFSGLHKSGHENFINGEVIPKFFSINNLKLDLKNFNSTAYLFSIMMSKVLLKYIDFNDRSFRKIDYFNEVYLKNIDIWGFINIYVEYIITSNYDQYIIVNLSNVLIEYCYSNEYADRPIDIKKLIIDLANCNKINRKLVNLKKLFNI